MSKLGKNEEWRQNISVAHCFQDRSYDEIVNRLLHEILVGVDNMEFEILPARRRLEQCMCSRTPYDLFLSLSLACQRPMDIRQFLKKKKEREPDSGERLGTVHNELHNEKCESKVIDNVKHINQLCCTKLLM